jgi:hypothetical protein
MRRRLALATILAVLVGGAMVASMAAAGQSSGSSTLRPWGRGLAAAAIDPATVQATPAGRKTTIYGWRTSQVIFNTEGRRKWRRELAGARPRQFFTPE